MQPAERLHASRHLRWGVLGCGAFGLAALPACCTGMSSTSGSPAASAASSGAAESICGGLLLSSGLLSRVPPVMNCADAGLSGVPGAAAGGEPFTLDGVCSQALTCAQ
jgi:hypothetical protein